MENSKSQIRFIKILLAIVAVVVAAQCTFWLSSFSNPTSKRENSWEKINPLNGQKKVAAPIVVEFLKVVHHIQ